MAAVSVERSIMTPDFDLNDESLSKHLLDKHRLKNRL